MASLVELATQGVHLGLGRGDGLFEGVLPLVGVAGRLGPEPFDLLGRRDGRGGMRRRRLLGLGAALRSAAMTCSAVAMACSAVAMVAACCWTRSVSWAIWAFAASRSA
ncbi:MAG: hypothetical protein R2705_06680 [Ilumatobacteraceae bacterium]